MCSLLSHSVGATQAVTTSECVHVVCTNPDELPIMWKHWLVKNEVPPGASTLTCLPLVHLVRRGSKCMHILKQLCHIYIHQAQEENDKLDSVCRN